MLINVRLPIAHNVIGHPERLNNLIKLILKPILSQFYALSIQKCVHRQVQGFSTGTCQIILGNIYDLEPQVKTF